MTQRFEGQMIDQGGLPGPGPMGPMVPEGEMPPMMGSDRDWRHPPPPPGMEGGHHRGPGGRDHDHDHDGRRNRRQMEAERDGDMMRMEPRK